MTNTHTRARPLRPPARTLSEHVKHTFALALPVMFGRAGLLMVITVALVVVGHAGPNDQAYFAAGFAPHMLVLVVGMGLVAGVTVLSAQANGAGNAQQCGRIWRLGLLLAAACGTGAAVPLLWGRSILQLAGQSGDIALHGGEVIWAFAPGMPAILMFIATSSFLESIGRPRPGMIISLAANIVNLALCWMFVFGKFGLPAMGAPVLWYRHQRAGSQPVPGPALRDSDAAPHPASVVTELPYRGDVARTSLGATSEPPNR